MNRCRPRGFTLLEILVTLTIIVTIISMVYGSYVAAAKATQGYAQRLSSLQRAHLALRQCETLIRGCYMPEDAMLRTLNPAPGSTPQPKEAAVTPWFLGHHQGPNGPFLSFVTQRPLQTDETNHSPLYRLRLQYQHSARTLSIVTLPFDQAEASVTEASSHEILVTDISTCTFRFFDGQRWQTQWDSSQAKTLPRAVEIELSVQTKSQTFQTCRTVIPLPCFRPAPKGNASGVSS